MEVTGFKGDDCTLKITIMIRRKDYPPTDLRMLCFLSKDGRLEMATQFTNYKQGDLSAYTQPRVSKECEPIH